MSTITTPTEIYYKSRRNLALFSGLLLLDNFAGIKHDPKEITVLPFTFEDVNLISPVLFFIFLYGVWQYWTAWYSQSPEVREYVVHRWDCLVVGVISALSFTLFCIEPTWLTLPYIPTPFAFLFSFWILAFFKVTVILHEKEQEEAQHKEETISNILINQNWILKFNPASPNGAKPITFEKDGAILEGNNTNESRWRANENLLEILNSEGKVFSRFRYNEKRNIFEHTNDEDTLSIRNQSIISPKAYLWDLRSRGISLRNRPIGREQDVDGWVTDFVKWREQVIKTAKMESLILANLLDRLDKTRPPPEDLEYFNSVHKQQVRNMSEMLARLQEYLEKQPV